VRRSGGGVLELIGLEAMLAFVDLCGCSAVFSAVHAGRIVNPAAVKRTQDG
jgi:hypothetical protein